MGAKNRPCREEDGSFLGDAQRALDKANAARQEQEEKEPLHGVELSLLGILLKKNELYHEIRDIVDASSFQSPFYQQVFGEIDRQMRDRHHIDAVTLRHGLSSSCDIGSFAEQFGEIELEAVASVPESELSERAMHYAERVREGSYQRSLADFARTLSHQIGKGEKSPMTAAEEMYARAREVMRVLGKKHKVHPIRDVLRENFTQIEDVRDRKSRILGLSTGYYELDDALSGLQDGLLYVIGGRPSMGKTSLITSILEYVVLKEQKPALLFSAEMLRQEISMRMMCSHARVDSNLLRAGKISEADYQRLVFAAGALHEAKLFINDDPLNIEELVKIAHDYKNIERIGLVAVDYLQKIKGIGYDDPGKRSLVVGHIAGELKTLAKELRVPVIVSSQLNRNPEAAEDRRPALSDLRESGVIEQEADVVVLLYREEYYNEESDKKGVAEAIIAKNRNGPTKTIELAFLKQFTRFENLASRPY